MVTTLTQRERDKEVRQHTKAVLNSLIGEQLIHFLGKPDGRHDIQVRELWEVHYRVNVFVGVDPASLKIAHSYFVRTDADGSIVESTPKITRRY